MAEISPELLDDAFHSSGLRCRIVSWRNTGAAQVFKYVVERGPLVRPYPARA